MGEKNLDTKNFGGGEGGGWKSCEKIPHAVSKSCCVLCLCVFFFGDGSFLCLKNKFYEEFLLEFHFHTSDLLCKIPSKSKGKVQNE